jgi:hypothetical protein
MFFTKPTASTVVVFALGVVGAGAGRMARETVAAGAEKEGPRTVILTDANYTQLHESAHPTDAELAWRKVPWLPSVWDGIVEGQKSDRPILMWILNGHPLACT